jgi:hypothetical protein
VTTTSIDLDRGAPEAEVARDLLRRMVPVAPGFVAVSALIWGVEGALSSLFALALVAANFAAAAGIMAWSAKISPGVFMAAVLGGYVVRLGLLTLAIFLVKDAAWVEMLPLGLTLVVAHLGLLVWEAKYVSLSLAFPGLKPSPEDARS